MRNKTKLGKNYQNTHFEVQWLFFWKSCRLWDDVEEYYRARHDTQKI